MHVSYAYPASRFTAVAVLTLVVLCITPLAYGAEPVLTLPKVPPIATEASQEKVASNVNHMNAMLGLSAASWDALENEGEEGEEGGNEGTSLALKAFLLDSKLELRTHGDDSYLLNWGGKNEKWIWSDAKREWYFILPNGEFYKWEGGTQDLSTSTLAETFSAEYYSDPTRLHQAKDPRVISMLARALELDNQYGFVQTGDYHYNWGGQEEKWFQGQKNGGEGKSWYYITPDGSIYAWSGQSQAQMKKNGTQGDTLIATLSGMFYADPVLLHEATAIVDGTFLYSAHELRDLRLRLGLQHTGNDYVNWGGKNEKWIYSTNGSWYYLTPYGNLYRWRGTKDLSTDEYITTLPQKVFVDMAILYDAGKYIDFKYFSTIRMIENENSIFVMIREQEKGKLTVRYEYTLDTRSETIRVKMYDHYADKLLKDDVLRRAERPGEWLSALNAMIDKPDLNRLAALIPKDDIARAFLIRSDLKNVLEFEHEIKTENKVSHDVYTMKKYDGLLQFNVKNLVNEQKGELYTVNLESRVIHVENVAQISNGASKNLSKQYNLAAFNSAIARLVQRIDESIALTKNSLDKTILQEIKALLLAL